MQKRLRKKRILRTLIVYCFELHYRPLVRNFSRELASWEHDLIPWTLSDSGLNFIPKEERIFRKCGFCNVSKITTCPLKTARLWKVRVTGFFQAAFQAVLDLAYKQTAFISTFFIGVVICALFRVFFSIFSRKDTNNWWVTVESYCTAYFVRKKNMKVFITYKVRRTIQKKNRLKQQNQTKKNMLTLIRRLFFVLDCLILFFTSGEYFFNPCWLSSKTIILLEIDNEKSELWN